MRKVVVQRSQLGLHFKDGELVRILRPGIHWIAPLFFTRQHVEVVNVEDPVLRHVKSEAIARSGLVNGLGQVVRLAGRQRALVEVDGRYTDLLGPGLSVVWTHFADVKIEVLEITSPTLEHDRLGEIVQIPGAGNHLDIQRIAPDQCGVLYHDGKLKGVLEPGLHVEWRNITPSVLTLVPRREVTEVLSGQEILTADKVSLRLNATVCYRIIDPVMVVSRLSSHQMHAHLKGQLALRQAVASRELETLLAERESLADELRGELAPRFSEYGMELVSVGVTDIILPGEMRALLNRVVEAKKAAESANITRREETAAIRMQANTARIFENNPMLMRLRELEALEKVSERANLTVVLGEGGLADRVVKLL